MGIQENNLHSADAAQEQPGDTGPASGGRGVGGWGRRLWNSFRDSFTKLIRATIRCTPGPTPSVSLEYPLLPRPSYGV